MIVALEDRRALSDTHTLANADSLLHSIMTIREVLTQTLQRLPEGAKSAALVRDMRLACHAFLNGVEELHPRWPDEVQFERDLGLGELRGVFGMNLAVLAEKFGIEVHPPLDTILPPDVDDEPDDE
jgi:hypothetical protein